MRTDAMRRSTNVKNVGDAYFKKAERAKAIVRGRKKSVLLDDTMREQELWDAELAQSLRGGLLGVGRQPSRATGLLDFMRRR
jgi:hypothetical protein